MLSERPFLEPKLLTDPFLQHPDANTVRVVWFTEFAGARHAVYYGFSLEQTAIATTTKLSQVCEDQNSNVEKSYSQPTLRDIWRHEAIVTNLPDQRIPYRVASTREDGYTADGEVFTLAGSPPPGKPLKILLTSDHQLKPMIAANCQKVIETIGRVDAVFFAGDLVDVPDRASDWFDDKTGNAFFPVLQGRARYEKPLENTTADYWGGALIQFAPLFTAIGNHEVMGRLAETNTLEEQFDDAVPCAVAEERYAEKATAINPGNDPAIRAAWIKNQSFNTTTYEEIFTLPETSEGGKKYYAVTFGDVRLVVLYITCIWRTFNLTDDAKGRYRERQQDLNNPDNWGYGQHIFEPIAQGSTQYNWLEQELNSPEFQQAKYRVVMFHHPPHTLGDNIVPAYTDPVQVVDRDASGQISTIRYEYPKSADYLLRDVVPLLEAAGTHLVFFGHSHLWNRFVSPNGTHYLETSNVGNSYGAFIGDRKRPIPANYQEEYVASGDPYGLEPVIPTIAPLLDADGKPQPFISSNEITVFSILDTGEGTISSYYFDTRQPRSEAVKFDEVTIAG
jgi:Icc-related predicted phosphoesterase